MGTLNKLLQPVAWHSSVLEATLSRAVASCDAEIIVVTGFEHEKTSAIVDAFQQSSNVETVHNPDFETGMGSSLKTGFAAAPEGSAILVWPADMPFVSVSTVSMILARNQPDKIVRPAYLGDPGHPVLFGSSFRSQLLEISDDEGARQVLEANRDHVVELDVTDAGVVRDLDTPGDFSIQPT